MGGAFSGSSLCRFVGAVEIVTSSVILAFGIQSLVSFHSMHEDFQHDFPRIQYSSIAAITHGVLSVLAALFLIIGSSATQPKGGEGAVTSRRVGRAASVFKSWLLFSVFSIGLLVFIFVAPIGYCLQMKEESKESQGCHTSSPEIRTLRDALSNLYSYSIVNVIALFFFLFVVYAQLKRTLRPRTSDKEACIDNNKEVPVDNTPQQ